MSEIVTEFVEALAPKVAGKLKGSARLDITGEGSVMLDDRGARAAQGDADVALKASAAVFRAILDGSLHPVKAVMTGKLKVDGSPQRALKVSAILTA